MARLVYSQILTEQVLTLFLQNLVVGVHCSQVLVMAMVLLYKVISRETQI